MAEKVERKEKVAELRKKLVEGVTPERRDLMHIVFTNLTKGRVTRLLNSEMEVERLIKKTSTRNITEDERKTLSIAKTLKESPTMFRMLKREYREEALKIPEIAQLMIEHNVETDARAIEEERMRGGTTSALVTTNKCSKCGHDKAAVHMLLIRADEPAIEIYKCLKCGHVDREGYHY